MTAALLGGARLAGGLLPGNQLAEAKARAGLGLPLLPLSCVGKLRPLYPSLWAEGQACGGLRALTPPLSPLSGWAPAAPGWPCPLTDSRSSPGPGVCLATTLAERRGQRLESTPGRRPLQTPAPSSVSQRPRGDRAHSAALAALWGQHPKVVEPPGPPDSAGRYCWAQWVSKCQQSRQIWPLGCSASPTPGNGSEFPGHLRLYDCPCCPGPGSNPHT